MAIFSLQQAYFSLLKALSPVSAAAEWGMRPAQC
jgi:hypothetical protein